jgi:hypothetical protein
MALVVRERPVGVAARWRLAVGVVAGLNAVAALAGSVGLVSGWLSLGDLTDRLPFGSSALGGVALALLVSLPQALLTLLAWLRTSATAAVSVIVGSMLVGWILVEALFLQVFEGLQVAYLVIGLVQIGLGLLLGLHDPGLEPRALAAMVWAVVEDTPRFLVAPFHRRRHLRWGATEAEVSALMPGDEAVPGAQYVSTRAVDIAAPPEAVWPWIVQVGADRAGWYSDDLLDNAGRPSADVVHPEWQQVARGDVVSMSPRTPPPPGTFFTVDSFDPPHWLLWSKSDSVWSWRLEPTTGGGTRLVTRVRARYDWQRPALALFGVLLMELGDYPMMRRMLLGIRTRATADRTGLTSW